MIMLELRYPGQGAKTVTFKSEILE